jgi:type IV pilus assembly protein PilV
MNSKFPQLAIHEQGFTLLESMLTLFVLTIGVLGVASLQVQALQAGGLAMQRTIVVTKSQEIIERMRVNNNINERLNAAGATVSLDAYDGATGSDNGCNSGTVCTSAQMASHDLFMWQSELGNALPGFNNAVVTVGAPPTNAGAVPVTVTITWTDRDTNYSYTVSADI